MADTSTKLRISRTVHPGQDKRRYLGTNCHDAAHRREREGGPVSKRQLASAAALFLAKHASVDEVDTSSDDSNWMQEVLRADIDPELPAPVNMAGEADLDDDGDQDDDHHYGIDGLFHEAALLGVYVDGCSKRPALKLDRSKEHAQMTMAVNSRGFSETEVPTATGHIRPFTTQKHLLESIA